MGCFFLLVNCLLGITLLRYITFCRKQLPLREQEDLSLQLQIDFNGFNSSLLKIFLLLDFLMVKTFGIEPQLISTLFQLKILWNLCVLGQCLSSRKKFFLPISLATLHLYGGLNHIILSPLLLFIFCASS